MYVLINVQALAAAHPTSFLVPDAYEISQIQPGTMVKVIAQTPGVGDGRGTERLWVRVESICPDGTYIGLMWSDPQIVPIRYGDRIEFHVEHIADTYEVNE